jgi:predicted small secreted protein
MYIRDCIKQCINQLNSGGVYLDVLVTLIAACFMLHFTWPTISKASLVLLQTAPEKFKIPLTKCIREASFIEGVLEIHGEHFWSIGMGPRASVIGTVKVRVSTDANEQQVLKNVKNVFQQKSFISDLTIQIEKDYWNISEPRSDIVGNSLPFQTGVIPVDADHLLTTATTTTTTTSNTTNPLDSTYNPIKITTTNSDHDAEDSISITIGDRQQEDTIDSPITNHKDD